MRIFLILVIMSLSQFSLAKEGDWIARAEMENMRTTDIVWLNSEGDIFWSSDLYTNAMPCKSKIEDEELIEFDTIIRSIPRVKLESKRNLNSQCKDGLNNDIYVSFEKPDGYFDTTQKIFPSSTQCQIRQVDQSWNDLAKKLYLYTSDKFKECKVNVWR